MSIIDNLNKLKQSLPEEVTLVAVSKTKPIKDILEAYNTGHKDFGENKVQELVEKHEQLPKDINWHMIGHVQRNKVKYMAEFIHLIHGVDSLKLLKEINKHAKKHRRIIDFLLQIKIAKEDSKFGISLMDAKELLESDQFREFNNVRIRGLMGMATFTDEEEIVKNEFKNLKKFHLELSNYVPNKEEFKILSMGMSGDYELALDCGSNMIRVGSRIFGERNY